MLVDVLFFFNKINLNIDEEYISENFLWDSEDVSNIKIKTFASYFLRDILAERSIELDKEPFMGTKFVT